VGGEGLKVRRLEGTVVLKSSRNVRVDTPEGELLCSLRGKFRTRREREHVPVAGDRVVVSGAGDGEGVLERILPRRTELWRARAGGRSVLVAANVDQLLTVVAAREPAPRWALVDRMLVAAHRDGLEPAVGLNKWDQVEDAPQERSRLVEIAAMYRELGYPFFTLSATEGRGLPPLVDWLRDRTTALAGHSGVGKSTLINALEPDFRLPVGDVNVVTGKGRHTTSAVRLLKLPAGGYAVDTPGFREFQPVDLPVEELGRHYPEFARVLSDCRFKDCLHHEEPGCAVRAAVEEARIPKMRYNNYLLILASLKERASPW
jgi:ribosome biogenesis GTPase